MEGLIRARIGENIEVKQLFLAGDELVAALSAIAGDAADAVGNGRKIIVCGNGGSASDSIHFAGEIVGRFQRERNPWPAVALNADVATMTAIANDYGYDEVFARQAQAHANPGDLFVGISSSGNSENVNRAAVACREIGCKTAALVGKGGGALKGLVDNAVVVPSDVTARIQEAHIMCIHIICEIVEERLA